MISSSKVYILVMVSLFICFSYGQRRKPPIINRRSFYEYGYRVRSHYDNSDHGHTERKNPTTDRVTGQYHVKLPDNRVQLVSYYADETGYHPTIEYLSHQEWEERKLNRNILRNSIIDANNIVSSSQVSSHEIRSLPRRRRRLVRVKKFPPKIVTKEHPKLREWKHRDRKLYKQSRVRIPVYFESVK